MSDNGPLSEWELLKITDDVDEGDTLSIGNSLNSKMESAILMGHKNQHTVILLDTSGKERYFNIHDLSERGRKTYYIAGKAIKQLKVSDIRK